LLLTRGRALTYATPHSPWTPVERARKPYAPCSHGKGAGGAMLDASDCGRAVTVCGALQASGPAVVIQRCPGVPAVDGGTSGTRRGPRTAGGGRRGLEPGRDSAGAAKLVRDSQGGKGPSSAGQDSGAPDTRRCSATRAGWQEGGLALLKTWTNVHAPAARKHSRSLYSDGR